MASGIQDKYIDIHKNNRINVYVLCLMFATQVFIFPFYTKTFIDSHVFQDINVSTGNTKWLYPEDLKQKSNLV